MGVVLHAFSDFPLTEQQVDTLWQAVCTFSDYDATNDEVSVASVSAQRIRELNSRYRNKAQPTNVLTFSDAVTQPDTGKVLHEHDVLVCLPVAKEEAKQRGSTLTDYVALLLVHGFLHAVGMDHERSAAEAQATQEAEGAVLQSAGFNVQTL